MAKYLILTLCAFNCGTGAFAFSTTHPITSPVRNNALGAAVTGDAVHSRGPTTMSVGIDFKKKKTILKAAKTTGRTTAGTRRPTTISLWYRDRHESEEQMTTTSMAKQQAQTRLQAASTLDGAAMARNSDSAGQRGGAMSSGMVQTGAVNLPLVKATCRSHLVAFAMALGVLSAALAWNAGTFMVDLNALHWNANMASAGAAASTAANQEAFRSLFDWTLTPARIAEGVLAAFPLVAMCNMMMENSEHKSTSCVYFSITNTVIALFGRRRQPPTSGNVPNTMSSSATATSTSQAVLFSLGIATVSAVSEQMIFRGLLPCVLISYTGSVGVALVGQALLSGLGQVRRQSSLTENGAFSLMHSINGLWYGAVYLATGGDILPVILAHILYELHIFVGAWKLINDQMDYTQIAASSSSTAAVAGPAARTALPIQDVREEWELEQVQQEAGESLSPETFQFCRRFFYAFDYDHRGSLSRADVKRAVAYAFIQESPQEKPNNGKVENVFDEMLERRHALQLDEQNVEGDESDADRLHLSEFLRLLFALKSNKWTNQMEY